MCGSPHFNSFFRWAGPRRSTGGDRSDCRNGCGHTTIVKYSFEGKMKDGSISKLLITKTGHRPIQYKKIIDTLLVLCADKNYQGIDDVVWNRIDRVKTDFMPPYPDVTWWSNTHHVKIVTVNPSVTADANTSLGPPIVTLLQKNTCLWHKFPVGVTIIIQTESQEQVSRVHQVSC